MCGVCVCGGGGLYYLYIGGGGRLRRVYVNVPYVEKGGGG